MIFLLDPLAQVLHGHVFLRQFHVQRAALVLQFRQPAALPAQIFFARRDFRFLRIFLRKQFRRLRVHLLALMRQTLNLAARILDLRFRLFLAR